MSHRVLVSSNCQTETLTEALSIILPDYSFHSVVISAESEGNWDYLTTELNNGADFLVSSDNSCLSKAFSEAHPEINVIGVPKVFFSAFHPDLVYAVNPRQEFIKCLDSDYHSAICLWAWKNKVTPEMTVKLFREEVFFELGYLNCWDESVRNLHSRFKDVKLDFGRFWKRMQRSMPFMYSVNHPNTLALAELAKEVAVKISGNESLYDEPAHEMMTERLDALRWPIYPPLASLYGLRGSYKWKIRRLIYCSLQEYVEKALLSYGEQGYGREEISLYTDGYEQFDAKMKALIRETK